VTEAQEKNHTDRVDLSRKMPHGQLMRWAVTYTHQARAGGTNAPVPSRKKFSLFLGPPHMYFNMLCSWSNQLQQQLYQYCAIC